jgi:1-acyl-sn-glycerol-3-phosphate acyltransferase
MLPTSADYFHAFFGVLLAGGVPVPLYPPTRLSQIEEHVRRHAKILDNSQAAALITTPGMRRLAGMLRIHAPSLRRIVTNEKLHALQAAPAPVATAADSPAFLQYTSGSTGQPKGVVLTHANLLANISALGAAAGVTSADTFVSWLPLYHDMGLIGAWLAPLYFGLPLVVMSPLAFLARPVRWLEAIGQYRGTLSAAPNFAYELCLKRVTDDELAGLDLSTWRLAMNGAEAVMPETLSRFQERFAKSGLPPTAMTPVYGLAESSVGLTFPPLERGPLIDAIERDALVKNGVATPASHDAENPLRFVSCGAPIPRHQVRIVDEAGRELGERREGRLEFKGPSATRGYFRNPQATEKLVRDNGWLDSGDRAYIADGEIFPTGRIKDIIIRAGRHIYPDEVETAIGAVNGVRKGCVAVFGGRDEASGTERVIVMAETYAHAADARAALRQRIIDSVFAVIGEPPDDVALVAPHTVLKTSSGKIRRAASREIYESGRYRTAQPQVGWRQLLKLSLSAIGPIARRTLRRLVELLYAAYFWMLMGILAGATYLLLLPPLGHATRWLIAHRAARTFIALSGIPFSVRGRERLSAARRQVIVANHSSYLDGIFLVAAGPTPCRFIAKRELERMPFIGASLRRLGSEFIERFDARASVEGARRLAAVAGRGPPCIFFPEGTFRRAPGLLPFHLGAFAAAVESGLRVLPIALHGTRSLLRDEQWLPRRVAVVMTIGEPIEPPQSTDAFAATVQLRDAARESIRAQCGEPDLLGSSGRRLAAQ